jgi:hypothetical protein
MNPPAVLRKMMAVNLDGVFLTVKHAARSMVDAGNGGSIITMASVTGLAGTPRVGHYAAAKAGVINLTKTAALELRAVSNSLRTCQYETLLLTHLLRLCELALLEAQPVWVRSLQIFGSETRTHCPPRRELGLLRTGASFVAPYVN